MTTTVSSPRMVGRLAELEALLDALDDGAAGRPRTVIVRGEAGIGKTRLLAEFIDQARGRIGGPPLVIASGQCVDLGPIGAPFTPIRRVLRDLRDGVGDNAFRAAVGSPAVIATLATLLPELSTDAAPPPAGPDYVAEAIERIVENLSADWHLLLVIEDLHWADAATLALLKTFATTLRGSHVTIVMTYRSDDVGRGHPLRAVLAELDRSRSVTGLEVTRLTPDEIAQQIALLGRDDLGGRAVEAVIARSEGVPFFVEELIELGDDSLPPTLRDLVLARVERLSTGTRDIVGALSAGGVRVEPRLLERVADADADAVRHGLQEALAEGVIVPDGDAYAFRHALIQESVHDELLSSVRADLHARYARELQEEADAGVSGLYGEISEHLLAARDVPGAFGATSRARVEAQTANAPVTAHRLAERMLELWPQVADAEERAGMSRGQLSTELATALGEMGDLTRGLAVARDALRQTPDEDRLTRARLLDVIGRTQGHLDGLRGDANIAYLEARQLLEGTDDPIELSLLARVVSQRATHSSGDLAERRADLEWAVATAEKHADGDTLATVYSSMSWFLTDRGERAIAIQFGRKAVGAVESQRRRTTMINNLVCDLIFNGRMEDAIDLGTAAIRECRDLGWERGLPALIASNVVDALLTLGRWPEARALAERGVTLAGDDKRTYGILVVELLLGTSWNDELEAADGLRDRAEAFAPDHAAAADTAARWAQATAVHAIARRSAATSPAERAGHARSALQSATTLLLPGVREAPGASEDVALPLAVAVTMADEDGVEPELSADVRTAIREVIAATGDDEVGGGYRASVEAEFTAGTSPAERIAAWERAVEALIPGRHDASSILLAQFRLAEALVEQGDRDRAAAVLADLVVRAPGLGCALLARWGRALATHAGLTIEGADAAPRAAPAASGVSSLTPRELQVLALVAEGLTNPQIGARLFISPKTASVHVSAILAKIGAANRAEAAALYATAQEPSR